MNQPAHDPRGAANLLLDLADTRGLGITNLALQKLLYFAHAYHLVTHRRGLVGGHFEAWQYGPVHPLVYKSFKQAGDQPIRDRAVGLDLIARREVLIRPPVDPFARDTINLVLDRLGHLSAGRLIELSHAKDGPWDFVVKKSKRTSGLGLRISDDVIRERFYRIGPVRSEPLGEPGEDTPPA